MLKHNFIDKEFLCHCNSIAIVKDRRSLSFDKGLIFPTQMVLNIFINVEVMYYSILRN